MLFFNYQINLLYHRVLLPNDPMIFLTNKLQKPVQNSLLIGCLHLQKIRRLKVPTNTAKIKEDMA